MTDSPDEEQSLADAYTNLTAGLKRHGLGAKQLRALGEGFRAQLPTFDMPVIDPLADNMRVLAERASRDQEAIAAAANFEFEPDTRPDEIAENTARAAELMTEQNATIAQLVEVTLANLAISKDQQAQAVRTEKFTKRMSVASLFVSIGSLAAAVTAVVVSIITTQS